jgi:hypothetical protein
MFAFDRLEINNKTIFGIILSLIGGTMFSYFEYTNKQTKSILTTIDNNDEQNEIKSNFDEEKMTINNYKFVYI